jgi:hypothetical protein
MLRSIWRPIDAHVARAGSDVLTLENAELDMLLKVFEIVAQSDLTCQTVLVDTQQSVPQRYRHLKELRSLQELRAEIDRHRPLAMRAFGVKASAASGDACASIAEWMDHNADIRELAATFSERTEPLQRAQLIRQHGTVFWQEIKSLFVDLNADSETLFAIKDLAQVPLGAIVARLQLWGDHAEQLSHWIAYRDRSQRAQNLGLTDLLVRLNSGRISVSASLPMFEMAYYQQLLSEFTRRDSALGRFDGELHSRKVIEFGALDLQHIEASRSDAVQAHYLGMPAKSGGVGPLGVLRAEMARRRGLMPIRQLMHRAGSVVQALKPVLMMSPLSIAQFLPPGQLSFDILVMDEASQIQPVDALGAIARARQVVVVGDERQLPPTRFFAKITNDEGEDDDSGAPVSDIESILGLFSARGLQQRMLRWHYRSRHQSLIAVSNSEFYQNKLMIVPSPYTAEAGMGLTFHHLPDAVFDSGASGANVTEAAVVAAAIISHAQTQPQYSLGVATFSVRQRQAIMDKLEALRRLHPETEDFFHAHPSEPFFVKNLENVQGDKRDIIFISVGYGKNAQGVMSMRFGPLGAIGGERRLNVLISRAKRRCDVYASMTDEDIDLERARGKGVLAFKLFLRYARTGRMDVAFNNQEIRSDLVATQIAAALQAQGHQVHPKIGVAGLFIDLAVADSEVPGRYILGIECDGASYRDATSARDRDRLRRMVLEDHGWIMYRIWSADWLHRPQEQLSNLIAAITSAKALLLQTEFTAPTKLRAVPIKVLSVERENFSEISLSGADDCSVAYECAQITPYSEYSEIPNVPIEMLATYIENVVRVEGPIHFDVLVMRIRQGLGFKRSGKHIQFAIEQAAELLLRSERLIKTDRFLSAPGVETKVRDRSAESLAQLRKAEYISPEEMRIAIVETARRNFGVKQSEIAPAVARLLGISSTSAGSH